MDPSEGSGRVKSAEELLNEVEGRLRQAGIEDAAIEARRIVEEVLGTDYSKIRAGLAHNPSASEIDKAFKYAEKRISGVPLAYVLCHTDFYGCRIMLLPGVFIPRPETEILVDAVIGLLDKHSWPEPKILDLYTGSGCILLAIKSARPNIKGFGMDIDTKSISIASANKIASKAAGLDFGYCPTEFIGSTGMKFHIVTANPPYIPTADIPFLQREVADHENRVALDGGPDGLNHLRILAENAPDVIIPGGYLLCEIGAGQKDDVEKIFSEWKIVDFVPDLAGHPRVLIAQPKE